MKKIVLGIILMAFALSLFGCGETLTGVSKDIRRMGKGVKTVFIRDSD